MVQQQARRISGFIRLLMGLGVAGLASSSAWGQLSPVGDHYAGQETAAGSLGGYTASVPLNLPAAREGMPVPVQVAYTGDGYGAVGQGWDVLLSFVEEHATSNLAHRRPLAGSGAPTTFRTLTIHLNGAVFDVELSSSDATTRTYVAKSDPTLKYVETIAPSATSTLYDAEGRTYTFSNTDLASTGLSLLRDISGPGGNKVHLDYRIATPSWIPASQGLSLDLTQVSYNPSPTTAGCYKNTVKFNYNGEGSVTLSLTALNGPGGIRFLGRRNTLSSIDVNATGSATCADTPTRLSSYKFHYAANGDADTQSPRLQSVTVVGRDGTPEAATSLPVATYGYGSVTVGGKVNFTPIGSPFPSPVSLSSVDVSEVTGDNRRVDYYTVNDMIDYTGDGLPERNGPPSMPPGFTTPVALGTTGVRQAPTGVRDLNNLRYFPTNGHSDFTDLQMIDMNGDGRLDVVVPGGDSTGRSWDIWLNTPDPTDANKIVWLQRRVDSTQLGEAKATTDLSLSSTVGSATDVSRKLIDVNGDGYPDLVFTEFNNTLLMVMFNQIGPHLTNADRPIDKMFSDPFLLSLGGTCAVEHWSDATQVCGLVDVNGDGILDRVVNGDVYLGTGYVGATGSFFSASPLMRTSLAFSDNALTQCFGLNHDNPNSHYTAFQRQGLLDLNGDGIPDIVGVSTVRMGTGAGYGPATPMTLNIIGSNIFVGQTTEDCRGNTSTTTGGLMDFFGDGRPLYFNGGSTWAISGSGGVRALDAGRLTSIDNGYGAVTTITYANAKDDRTTSHQVPRPEIVVASVRTDGTLGLGGSTAQVRYAYGDAQRHFDSSVDRWVFDGYREVVAMHTDPGQSDGWTTVTTSYPLSPLDIGSTGNTTSDRYGRYMRVGKTRDVFRLNEAVGTNPYTYLTHFRSYDSNAALSAIDARIVEATHSDWLVQNQSTKAATGQDCIDMVLPYDFAASRTFDTTQGSASDPAFFNLDVCAAHGFIVEQATDKRGTAAGSASFSEVREETQDVDELGRVTAQRFFGDTARSDDDVCTRTSYATPTASGLHILSAVASTEVNDCAATPKILKREHLIYDQLDEGSVSSGFVTSTTAERRDENGSLLGTIHVFDAAIDAQGLLQSLTTVRNGPDDDNAQRTQTFTYDPFGLVITSVTTSGTNGDGSHPPPLTNTIVPDSVSLRPFRTTDESGISRTWIYDGFGRSKLELFSTTGSTSLMQSLASRTYMGFDGVDASGRRITATTDTKGTFFTVTSSVSATPVPGQAAAGLTATTFLDELGRARRTETALGTDYANGSLVTGLRIYDGFGRVAFAADPFAGGESLATIYGSTFTFGGDGRLSCMIRGNGRQTASVVDTNEASNIYTTCNTYAFTNRMETIRTKAADGARKVATATALGRVIDRATFGTDGSRSEYVTYSYDPFGRNTSVTRYGSPVTATNSSTTSLHYDSFGWLREFDAPGTAPRIATFSNWGEVTEEHWCDATTTPCVDHSQITKFDAFGRPVHREDKSAGQTDPSTVYDYAYDTPATGVRITPTNVLGRLASVKSPGLTTAFSYGPKRGELSARDYNDGTSDYVESFGYRYDGLPLTTTFNLPDNGFVSETTTTNYDSAGRLRSMSHSDPTATLALFSNKTFDPRGRILDAMYGASELEATYNEIGRRTIADVTVSTPAPVSHSREIAYMPLPGTAASIQAFDPVGRERTRQEFRDGVAVAPPTLNTYDSLGRLTASRSWDATRSASTGGWQFAYDALGNMTSKTDLAGALTDASAQFSQQTIDPDRLCNIHYGPGASGSSCNVTYDGAGRVVSEPAASGATRTLSYYGSGYVKHIEDGSSSADYVYDAFGDVQSLDLQSGTSTDIRHDRHFGPHLVKRNEATGGATAPVLTREVAGAGMIATHHGPAGPWTIAFSDARGTRFAIDRVGQFVQDTDYEPFGKATSTGAAPGSSSYLTAQWNAGDNLSAFGLSRLGARIYDPVIGRFLSRDLLFNASSATKANPYAFAGNDPINFGDPTGLTVDGGPAGDRLDNGGLPTVTEGRDNGLADFVGVLGGPTSALDGLDTSAGETPSSQPPGGNSPSGGSGPIGGVQLNVFSSPGHGNERAEGNTRETVLSGVGVGSVAAEHVLDVIEGAAHAINNATHGGAGAAVKWFGRGVKGFGLAAHALEVGLAVHEVVEEDTTDNRVKLGWTIAKVGLLTKGGVPGLAIVCTVELCRIVADVSAHQTKLTPEQIAEWNASIKHTSELRLNVLKRDFHPRADTYWHVNSDPLIEASQHVGIFNGGQDFVSPEWDQWYEHDNECKCSTPDQP